MSYDIGPRISVQGEAEFNAAVKLMEKNFAALNAEMNLATAQFAKNDKSAAALTAQNQVLNKQIEEQSKKIPLLTSQYEKQNAKLSELAKKLEDAGKEFGESSKEASKAQAAYDRQAAVVTDLGAKITNTKASIAEMTRTVDINAESIKLQTSTFGRLGEVLEAQQKGIENAGKALSVASAAIVAGAGASAKAAIDWESAFAGVRKTVEASEEEYTKLSDSIRQMAKEIPVAATEIAKIAENAGQLGIKTENIMSFTRAMADLGVSTNLSGEQAAQAFAQFANITGMAQSDFDRLGSSIVALGNNLATTESNITDMAQRLAAAATQAGFSEAEILGLAGALSSVGLEAQAGGTAFSKAINMMTVAVETGSADLEAFGEIAGMSAQQFAKAYKEDAAGAVIAFTEGLGDMERHGKSATVLLEELGLTETRLRDSLTRAANAGDLFRNAIELSNTAWSENIALTKEAEARYETTASKIQIAKNNVTDAAITLGQDLLPIIVKATEGVKDFTGWFVALDDGTKKFILNTLGITAALGPLLLAFSKGVKIYSDIKAGMQAAETAQKALNVAMAGGVWAVAAIGVSLVTAAVVTLVQKSKEATAEVRELNDAAKALADDMEASNKAYADRTAHIEGEAKLAREHLKVIDDLSAKEKKSAEEKALLAQYVRELNELMPGLNLQYNAEADALNMTSAAIADYIDKKREMLVVQAAEEMVSENTRLLLKNQIALTDAADKRKAAEEALAKAVDRRNEVEANISESGLAKVSYLSSYNDAVNKAQKAVDDLTAAEQTLAEQGDVLREDIKRTRDAAATLAGGFDTTANEADNAAAAVMETAEANEAAAFSTEELDKRTADLQGSYKTLNGVLIDLANGQDINATQMLDLIRTYPELAGSIEMVDGALRLEEQAVRELITAQIDAEIAILEAQLAQEEAVINASKSKVSALGDEVQALAYLSEAYRDAKADPAARAAAEENVKRIKATKTALEALKNEMGKTTDKATKTAKSVAKTVDPYKEAIAEIEHLHKMGQLSDEEYYDALAKNRDEFLDINTAEWRSATEKLYTYEKQKQKERLAEYEEMNRQLGTQYQYGLIDHETYLAEMERLRDEYFEENAAGWEEAGAMINEIQQLAVKESLDQQVTWLEDFREEYKVELDKIIADYDRMVEKLQSYGDLFKIEDDALVLEDLDKQTKVLLDYGKALEKLEGREIPEGLMDEILGMDVETGLRYARRLIAMGDADWNAYINAWERKQQAARDIAEKFYQDELDALNEKFVDKIPKELSGLKDELKDIGITSAQGLALGFASQTDWIAKTFGDALDRAIAQVKAAQEGMSTASGPSYSDSTAEISGKITQTAPDGSESTKSARQIEDMFDAFRAIQSASSSNVEVKVYMDSNGMARDLVDPLAVEIERKG